MGNTVVIGHMDCDRNSCDGTAVVRENEQGKINTFCESCGFQGQARRPKSIEDIKANMRPTVAANDSPVTGNAVENPRIQEEAPKTEPVQVPELPPEMTRVKKSGTSDDWL